MLHHILTIITYIIVWFIHNIFDHATYVNTSEDRRNEYLNVWFFYGRNAINTNVTISRAHSCWFDRFRYCIIGLTTNCVIVIPLYKCKNKIYIPIGKLSKSKNRLRTYCVCCGMCDAMYTIKENAQKELHEELGLKLPNNFKYVRMLPCDGFRLIVHLYWYIEDVVNKNDIPKFYSHDGTFESIKIYRMNYQDIIKHLNNELSVIKSSDNESSTKLPLFLDALNMCLQYVSNQVNIPSEYRRRF